ncbi:hypothetical protein DLREEDagrD3_16340 [Denitratisoma sp. agr-D3]
MPANSLGKFIDSDSGLARYTAHAALLVRLQRAYEKAAPSNLVRSGRVANLKQGVVVIYATSGAAAAKLRQLAPRLTDLFRQIRPEVSEVQIKVQPASPQAGPAAAVGASLKTTAKQGLENLTGRLPDSSPLKRALTRFLGRAKQED